MGYVGGTVIGESPVTREQLLMQGRLIPNEALEQQLIQQAMAKGGYMSGGVGMVITDFTQFQQAKEVLVMGGGRPPVQEVVMQQRGGIVTEVVQRGVAPVGVMPQRVGW